MSTKELKKGLCVQAGKDRFNENSLRVLGALRLFTKLSSKDTGGALYVFEHAHLGKGGPPRHVHLEQDEWFYVVQGEFVVEMGDETLRAKPGDSVWAPRGVPHAWACVSDTPGTLLTVVSPAGNFETFMREAAKLTELPEPEEFEKLAEAHGIKPVGPPLQVDKGLGKP